MVKQIFSFQRLLLINTFQLIVKKADIDKSKNSGYVSNFATYAMFLMVAMAIMMCDTSFGYIMYFSIFLGLLILGQLLMKDTGLLFKTLPVKNSFVVTNLILLYPVGYLILPTLALGYCLIAFPISILVGANNVSEVGRVAALLASSGKIMFFAFLAGLCIFAAMLVIFYIRTKWLKVTVGAIFSLSIIIPVIWLRFLRTDAFLHTNSITSWVNKLTAGSYCASLLVLCAVFVLLYAICLKLYSNRG